MIRTQVYIPDDIYQDLTILAKMREKNISQLLREGAKEVIRKSTQTKVKKGETWGKDFFGAIKTKVKTNATRDIHEYYEKYAI